MDSEATTFAKSYRCSVPMQGTTEEGYKIIYGKLIDPDVSKYDFNQNLKITFMYQDFMMLEEGANKGVHFVIDLSNMAFGHMTKINPFVMKKAMIYLQEAMPAQIRGISFVNPVPFMDSFLALIRPFLNKNTSEVLRIYNTMEDLHKKIPKSLLPLEAGGSQPSMNILHENYMKKIMVNREWFIEEEKLRVEESVRPGKAKNAGDLFGVEGTFKKLEID